LFDANFNSLSNPNRYFPLGIGSQWEFRSATQSTAMQLASGALWVFAASVLHGDLAHFSMARLDLRTDLALLFLVLCGTVLAFGSFTWLLRVASPAAVSSYAFVNPIVALALGVAVGDDALSGRIVLSTALVIAAVVLTRGKAPASRTSRVEVAETSLRIAS